MGRIQHVRIGQRCIAILIVWPQEQAARRMPRLTLFCLPYAGGQATVYRGWAESLPAWIECVAIELPGHGHLRREAPHNDWATLIYALAAELDPLPAGPFAIYGHSMGALVALELAHRLRYAYGRSPVWLGVAACTAPSRRTFDDSWLLCTDEVMVAELRRLGGTPEELLADREFLDIALPALRADFHMCGTYSRVAEKLRPPLNCAMLALRGRSDVLSVEAENLSAWRCETSGPFFECVLDGSHFFLETHREQLISEIVVSLLDTLALGLPTDTDVATVSKIVPAVNHSEYSAQLQKPMHDAGSGD